MGRNQSALMSQVKTMSNQSYQKQLADLYKTQALHSDKRRPDTYAKFLAQSQPTIDDEEDDLLAALSGNQYGAPTRFLGGAGMPLPSSNYAALPGSGVPVRSSYLGQAPSPAMFPGGSPGNAVNISYAAPDGTMIQMSATYSGENKGQIVDGLFKAAYQMIMNYAGQSKKGGDANAYQGGGKSYSGGKAAAFYTGKGGK